MEIWNKMWVGVFFLNTVYISNQLHVNTSKDYLTITVRLTSTDSCKKKFTQVLFGGNLIALEKKTGGVRPIAIGHTLRCISAKCANSFASSQLEDHFSPTS